MVTSHGFVGGIISILRKHLHGMANKTYTKLEIGVENDSILLYSLHKITGET